MNLDRFGPAPDDDGPWICCDCCAPVNHGEEYCYECGEAHRQQREEELISEEEADV